MGTSDAVPALRSKTVGASYRARARCLALCLLARLARQWGAALHRLWGLARVCPTLRAGRSLSPRWNESISRTVGIVRRLTGGRAYPLNVSC